MRKFESINVIPFIDIMLVLLAIVLTTATFMANGHLKIALPEAAGDTGLAEPVMVEVAIDQNSQYFVDGEALAKSQVLELIAAMHTSTHVVLVIDETVDFGLFVELIDVLKERLDDQVTIRTRKKSL